MCVALTSLIGAKVASQPAVVALYPVLPKISSTPFDQPIAGTPSAILSELRPISRLVCRQSLDPGHHRFEKLVL